MSQETAKTNLIIDSLFVSYVTGKLEQLSNSEFMKIRRLSTQAMEVIRQAIAKNEVDQLNDCIVAFESAVFGN